MHGPRTVRELPDLLALLGPRYPRERVGVHVEELLTVAVGVGPGARRVVVLHGFAQRGKVARLFEAFDGRLAAGGEYEVPDGKDADDDADDTGEDAEKGVVHGRQVLNVGRVVADNLL